MVKHFRRLTLLWVLLFAGLVQAQDTAVEGQAQQLREFADTKTEQRYQQLVNELRCPKCQNQNLADSDAPIAADLRQRLYELLQQGKTDSEILQAMQTRYGTFVLYQPPLQRSTAVLWVLPAAVLLIGILAVLRLQRHSRKAALTAGDGEMENTAQGSKTDALSSDIDQLRRELGDD